MSSLDWAGLQPQWERDGFVQVPAVLGPGECRQLIATYEDDKRFRARIDMARYNFGQGNYAYFSYPLPELVRDLRFALYTALAPWANRLVERLGQAHRYPAELAAFLSRCHAAGQTRPTPLLLRYEASDFNCLHRDLYGDLAFPVQAALFLSDPGRDYTGGEFVLVENRPRQQSRVRVLRPGLGDMVIFPTHQRPVEGVRKVLAASVRHAVSEVRHGKRWVLGIIFHDAA